MSIFIPNPYTSLITELSNYHIVFHLDTFHNKLYICQDIHSDIKLEAHRLGLEIIRTIRGAIQLQLVANNIKILLYIVGIITS